MKTKSTSQSAFFNLRVSTALVFCLAGVLVARVGFGAFSAHAQQKQRCSTYSTDALVPAGCDCSRGPELGIDKQENLRAGAIMIACGEAQGGAPAAAATMFQAIKKAIASLSHGAGA